MTGGNQLGTGVPVVPEAATVEAGAVRTGWGEAWAATAACDVAEMAETDEAGAAVTAEEAEDSSGRRSRRTAAVLPTVSQTPMPTMTANAPASKTTLRRRCHQAEPCACRAISITRKASLPAGPAFMRADGKATTAHHGG